MIFRAHVMAPVPITSFSKRPLIDTEIVMSALHVNLQKSLQILRMRRLIDSLFNKTVSNV
jgi:hypothetical protein